MTTVAALMASEPIVERLGAPGEIEETVGLPVDVTQLGDHVAGDGRVAAKLRDLVPQRLPLVLLGGSHQTLEPTESAVETERLDPCLEAAGPAGEWPGLEPPRLGTVRAAERPRVRQPPGSELRQDQRLVAALLRVAVRAPQPARPISEVRDAVAPRVGVVGGEVVDVEVREVRPDVEVLAARAPAGGVVDDQPVRVEPAQVVVRGREPPPLVGRVPQVGAPVLVDDRPGDDRRVVAERGHHLGQRGQAGCRGGGAEAVPVGQLAPDEHARLVRGVQVGLVGDRDVAAQQVEPELARPRELLVEDRAGRRRGSRVGVVVLVEGAEQVDRTPVERHPPVARAHVAHTEPRRHDVERPASIVREPGLGAIEGGGAKPPGDGIRDLDVGRPGIAGMHAVARPARHRTAVGIEHLDRQVAAGVAAVAARRRRPGDGPADRRPSAGEVRTNGERPDVDARTALERHRSHEAAG